MWQQQWRSIQDNRWLQWSVIWLPLLLAAFLWWIFSAAIVRDLPIGVVDLSHSTLSRSLIRDVDATSTLAVTRYYASVDQASDDLIQSKIYAYIVIPYRFDRDLTLGHQPTVTTFYNSQYILTGRLVNSAVATVQASFNAKVDLVKTLSRGQQTTLGALANAVPIQTQMTPLFNLNMNYAQFLLSGIIPALWQIIIVASVIMVLANNHQQTQDEVQWQQAPLTQLLRVITPYLPWFALQGMGYLYWFYCLLGWPNHGHLIAILAAQWLTIAACVVMGILFYLITLDAARSLSFAAAYTAPSFAFMGVTFPATNMGTLATLWRDILPISHYIEVQIQQVNYGLSSWESLPTMLNLLWYTIPLAAVLWLAPRRLTPSSRAAEDHSC
ncbi:ABC transporter permease [Vibrio porteresiae]|uniref:ABC transporter permease n=1 Tax=Vibrio porteresiae DSM 19223 TaxID=1123496 RepID=A0ABZ0QFQ8_9VIBR|nr:ABC transporter permease [Vibrio porteresiae]WPC75308.1 ABC transporter permease [Vibrio porteresiae DSM 19223]